MKKFLMPMVLQFFAEQEVNSTSTDTENSSSTSGDDTATSNEQTNETSESDADKKEGQKKYSRDDVGKMVAAETQKAVEKARLEWEKNNSGTGKGKNDDEGSDEIDIKHEQLTKKEQELAAKEIRLEYREKVQTDGLPSKVIELIDCTDSKKAKRSYELAKEIFEEIGNTSKQEKQFLATGNPGSMNQGTKDPFLVGLGVK
ncbi:hypothetical protein [Enterococcus faecium]|uniref:hypothetical protein n=1 Tax=Enterococcus faecium TaxID=1352 RepID=UPI0018AACF96|nr:hypothetical protein [Enterococcus faecium]